MRRLPLLLALLAAAARADAPAGERALDLVAGEISYVVVHKLHQVRGISRAVEGRALVAPDGGVRVQVRVPVKSFDSGNANRDVHMREATHEAEHPFAQVRGRLAAPGLRLPLTGPLDLLLEGSVELNGTRLPLRTTVHLAPDGATLRARFSFPVSLDALHVERPELLLVKVDDPVQIEGELTFAAAPEPH